jgi:hypothetical protein
MEESKKKIVDDFNYMNNLDDDEYNDSDNIDEKEDCDDEEYKKYLIDTAYSIQNNLFDYVKTYGLPLCEKLDINKIIDFIEKVN